MCSAIRSKSKPKILILSSDSKHALQGEVDKLLSVLQSNNLNLDDLAYRLQMKKHTGRYKKFLVCSDVNNAIQELSNEDSLYVYSEEKGSDVQPDIIFMFPGQGLQSVNMGKSLYEEEAVFKKAMDMCFAIVEKISKYNIKKIFYPNITQETYAKQIINLIDISPVITFIFEYSLAKLLISWEILPSGMIGHSIGEYVAACISGIFSLEDALRLVIIRGKLMKTLPLGKMISVPLAFSELSIILPDSVSIAADHGDSCIVSGLVDAIDKFQEYLTDQRLIFHTLNIQRAGHSQTLSKIANNFYAEIKKTYLNSIKIPFISNVTGDWIKEEEAKNPRYWVSQLKNTVRFYDGLHVLSNSFNEAVYLEVGPGNVLTTMVSQKNIQSKKNRALNLFKVISQERDSDIIYLYVQLTRLWLLGVQINWGSVGDHPKVGGPQEDD